VFLGTHAGLKNINGHRNVFLGHGAGHDNAGGSGNIMIGHSAGYYETADNTLYIDNSDTEYPLIYGDFYDDFADINGDLYVFGTLYEVSDLNRKTNIVPLQSSLDKLMSLQGVSFDWAADKEQASTKGASVQGSQIGMIAQDVETVLPALVRESRKGEKAVNYSGLIPVLLEAIKEQQGQIELLEQRIAELEQ